MRRFTSGSVGERGGNSVDACAFFSQLGGPSLDVCLRACADHERRALGGECLRDRLTDLARVAHARDDGDLAFETARHFAHPLVMLVAARPP